MCIRCGNSSTNDFCQSCFDLSEELKEEILLDLDKVMLEDVRQKLKDYTQCLLVSELLLVLDIKIRYLHDKKYAQIIHFCRELNKNSIRLNNKDVCGVLILFYGLQQNFSEYLAWLGH